MKKIIATLCTLTFCTTTFATPYEFSRSEQMQLLRLQRSSAEGHLDKLLKLQTIEELKSLVTRDLEKSLPQVREHLVQLWRSGNDKKLGEIYDQISKKDPNYISRVIGADRNLSLDKATAMLHLYSMSSIPKMLNVMLIDIAKMGGLKVFQQKLEKKKREAELFAFSEQEQNVKALGHMNGDECLAYGALAAVFAMSIVLLPLAIIILPFLIIGCS